MINATTKRSLRQRWLSSCKVFPGADAGGGEDGPVRGCGLAVASELKRMDQFGTGDYDALKNLLLATGRAGRAVVKEDVAESFTARILQAGKHQGQGGVETACYYPRSKGITQTTEHQERGGGEKRYVESYPFHPN